MTLSELFAVVHVFTPHRFGLGRRDEYRASRAFASYIMAVLYTVRYTYMLSPVDDGSTGPESTKVGFLSSPVETAIPAPLTQVQKARATRPRNAAANRAGRRISREAGVWSLALARSPFRTCRFTVSWDFAALNVSDHVRQVLDEFREWFSKNSLSRLSDLWIAGHTDQIDAVPVSISVWQVMAQVCSILRYLSER